ncbi:MAG: DUF2071 domain-containing protein [Ardenticatenaceae bacterium]|nr:DUF2071 domain-containing protein [Ardenticatenaceae bacterium]
MDLLVDKAQTILERRIGERPSARLLDIHSDLLHFALINYALPPSRLRPHIPDRFDIPEFDINGEKLALMSAVPFWDADFRFVRLAPWLKWQFAQTNYRVYVVERQTGEHVVWFFGTTLGSPIVYAARGLWGIPWHYARYAVDCVWVADAAAAGRYHHYHITAQSDWASAEITLTDMGQPITCQPGFTSMAEMQLILTHPVVGFYFRLNGRLGSYSIWHDLIPLTTATPQHLYFSLYERLNLLSRSEMQQPHSIFLCPRTTFDVHLPPLKL